MRQKHKNMFESAVLIVKRLKTRARSAGMYEAYVRTLLTQSSETADFNKYSNLISPRESYIYSCIVMENESKLSTLTDTIKHALLAQYKTHNKEFISSFYFAKSHTQNSQF